MDFLINGIQRTNGHEKMLISTKKKSANENMHNDNTYFLSRVQSLLLCILFSLLSKLEMQKHCDEFISRMQ